MELLGIKLHWHRSNKDICN